MEGRCYWWKFLVPSDENFCSLDVSASWRHSPPQQLSFTVHPIALKFSIVMFAFRMYINIDIFTATNISCNHYKLTSEALNCISHDQRHQRAFDFMLSVRALAFGWNTMQNSCPRKSEKIWKNRQLFKTPITTPKEVEQKINKNRTTTERKDGKQKIIMFHWKMHRETVDFRHAIFSWYEMIRL